MAEKRADVSPFDKRPLRNCLTKTLVAELRHRGWDVHWVHGNHPQIGFLDLEGPEQKLLFATVEQALEHLDDEVTE
jgi:carbamate kinase